MNAMVDVDALQERVMQLEALERARVTRARRRVAVLAVLGALLSVGAMAADGTCPNGLPWCFQANQPVRASDINHNFSQLREWIAQKVGTPGSPDVTITGALIVDGGASFGGNANIGGTLTIGGDMRVLGSVFGDYQEGPRDGGSLPADGGTFAPDAGFVTGRDYRASTDGFLTTYMWGATGGDLCYAHLRVDGVIRGTLGLHNYALNQTYVNDDAATVPVKKGSVWRVHYVPTGGSCNLPIAWVPVAP